MRSETVNPELAPQIPYETKDVNMGQTMWAIVALLAFFVLCMGFIYGVYRLFVPNWAKLDHQESFPVNRRLPPYPQLQAEPQRDFQRYRQAEDTQLAGKNATMSVDQAIDVMATQKGIAGIRGDAASPKSDGYPGQTTAIGAPAPAEKTETPAAPSAEKTAPPAAGEAGQSAH